MKICALQLGTLPMSDSRLDYYLRLAKEGGAGVVVLGEYVLNSFFTELAKMPKSMIKEQSEQKRASLSNLARKYDLTIIAPIVQIKGKETRKLLAKFAPESVKYKEQNALMPYSHWNERAFFAHEDAPSVMSFSAGGFKFAAIFGFEAHFDAFWEIIRAKKIDCVLVPTACALDSGERWAELLKMRAFTNNVYILRANRLGKAKFEGVATEFYGRSFLASPHGEITNALDEKEGMLICDLDKKLLAEARATWKFREINSNLNIQI